MPPPILLYDGVCGMCNRLVQFILRHDSGGVFRFASLQSPLAGRILARHGTDVQDLDTVYVVLRYEQPDEMLLARSNAVIFVLRHLGEAEPPSLQPGSARPIWRLLGLLLKLFPRVVRDCGYRLVARNRYRVFGRYDSCPLPSQETRSRFLDL